MMGQMAGKLVYRRGSIHGDRPYRRAVIGSGSCAGTVEWAAMFSRKALAIFALVVAEVAVARAAADQVGARPIVLIMLVSVIVGAAVLRRQIPRLLSEGARRLTGDEPAGDELPRRGVLVLAGFLIAVPGLLTSAAGIICFLPPIRALIIARFRPLVTQSFPLGFTVPFSASYRSPRRRDAVDVDVVTDDIRESARPELN